MARINAVREAMDERELTHLVVYADREHFANLAYLTQFDPRFEEALLILRHDRAPLLLVGNECESRLPISPLLSVGQLRWERYQPFSLLDQPRDQSRLLKDIMGDEGINDASRVGCVGYKYFTEIEHPDPAHSLDIPSFIADALRALAGPLNVVNATDLFMHAEYGLRARCSAAEIAFFEYSNILASEGMKRVLWGLEEGITDFELAKKYQCNGLPLNCHLTMKTGGNIGVGLSSPSGTVVREGDPFGTNMGYWGSNSSRAGWVVRDRNGLPDAAGDYVDAFAGPYFSALADWFALMKIGAPGGELYRCIQDRLPFSEFGISLNPGHLIHMDEWLSSPIYPNSRIEIRSGMYLQVDIIPVSKRYFSTRMEDGVVIANQALREQLETEYPDCYQRCQARRDFMVNQLGIELSPELLPLSNIPGIVPPYLLDPRTVLCR